MQRWQKLVRRHRQCTCIQLHRGFTRYIHRPTDQRPLAERHQPARQVARQPPIVNQSFSTAAFSWHAERIQQLLKLAGVARWSTTQQAPPPPPPLPPPLLLLLQMSPPSELLTLVRRCCRLPTPSDNPSFLRPVPCGARSHPLARRRRFRFRCSINVHATVHGRKFTPARASAAAYLVHTVNNSLVQYLRSWTAPAAAFRCRADFINSFHP